MKTRTGKYAICMLITTLSNAMAGPAKADAAEEAEGYLSLGLGIRHTETWYAGEEEKLSVFFNGRFQWRGFFLEAANGPGDALIAPTLGYNYLNTDHWSHDVVLAWTDNDIKLRAQVDDEVARLYRDSSAGFGFRSTGAYGNYTMQMVILPFYHEQFGNGHYASAWLAHDWALKNWTLQGVLGAQYRSDNIMNYYYGVRPDESSDIFPYYKANAGTNFTAQLDATYPLTRNWIFQSYLRLTELSDSAKDSPLIRFAEDYLNRSSTGVELGVSFSYVF